jgi:hypothetical protein
MLFYKEVVQKLKFPNNPINFLKRQKYQESQVKIPHVRFFSCFYGFVTLFFREV